MVKINYRAFGDAFDDALEQNTRAKAIQLVQEQFENAKEEFLQEFLDHPVSREIEEGEKTEGQILPVEGNLFSFIGFNQGEQPIEDLYNFLNDKITINKTPTYDKTRKRFIFTVKV